MDKEIGVQKRKALEKYAAPGNVMTRETATEIVETLWGDAPAVEKLKAIMICHQYNLNPLMKHLHLVGYRRRDAGGNFIVDKDGNYVLDWTIMQGIQATRLQAHRKHKFTYLDMTPRKATKDEIDKILGDTADPDWLYGFCHIKDLQTGAESYGLRGCPKSEKVKGRDKGNTPLNMAWVRSERLALERLYPGEMPEGIDTMDEQYLDTDTGEIIEGEARLVTTQGAESSKAESGDLAPGETVIEQLWPEDSLNQDLPLGKGQVGKTVLSPPWEKIKRASDRALDKKMLFAAAGKLKWDIKRLNQELTDRIGTSNLDKLTNEQLHDIASKVTDLAELA